MKTNYPTLVILILGALAFIGVWLGPRWAPAQAVVWVPPENPGLVGPFEANDRLSKIATLAVGRAPEHVACDMEGQLYTGLEDGSIMLRSLKKDWKLLGNTKGRPLGLRADNRGGVWIADAVKGVLHMNPEGKVQILVDSINGKPLRFVDDLDIDFKGQIWFSDASQRFDYHSAVLDFYEGSRTGRLLRFDPASDEVEVMMDNLFFANGVTLGPSEQYVLVNETGMGRVHRLWIDGELAGKRDIFLDALPGTPDNIRFDGQNTFWIAMPSYRASLDAIAPLPTLRSIISYLPIPLLETAASPTSFVIGVNLNGKVVHNLQAHESPFDYITGVTPCNGQLYLGSLSTSSVGVLPYP